MLSSILKPPRISLALLLIVATGAVAADNAFDLSDGLIPADEIHAGGPPRDGIPALTDPAFVSAAKGRSVEQLAPFPLARSALQSPIAVLTQTTRRYCVFAEAIVE